MSYLTHFLTQLLPRYLRFIVLAIGQDNVNELELVVRVYAFEGVHHTETKGDRISHGRSSIWLEFFQLLRRRLGSFRLKTYFYKQDKHSYIGSWVHFFCLRRRLYYLSRPLYLFKWLSICIILIVLLTLIVVLLICIFSLRLRYSGGTTSISHSEVFL